MERPGSMDKAQIEKALSQAMTAWNFMVPGFVLSTRFHYQLSNRFAFAWKLAVMKIPVVLVYLGFLDAHEMEDQSRSLLKSPLQWNTCVLNKSNGMIPQEAWNKTFDVQGTPLSVLIRSASVGIISRSAKDELLP